MKELLIQHPESEVDDPGSGHLEVIGMTNRVWGPPCKPCTTVGQNVPYKDSYATQQ